MNKKNSPKPVILCVDDEVNVLQSLRIALRNGLGDTYFYEIAESPDEAMEILADIDWETMPVVAIISDWLMPGMKGDEFLIAVHKKYPQIVKIMMTGQADKSAIARAKKYANMHDCVSKPWSDRLLIETIKSALDQ
ncbi:response regulator [Microseira sp. BLCC-F43]|jgi:CheY-like chemotaxis protein|uniref:response regulator n=1 Tax=Microseira sp. BLCC-F43 TaxID=3153602 RepID=UPI0035BAFB8D